MLAAAIRAELDKAARLDAGAREHRQRAARMLREAMSKAGGLQNMTAVVRKVGLDPRMVELLLQMAPISLTSLGHAPKPSPARSS